jgi:hypothetical protein
MSLVSNAENRPKHSSTVSDHSSRSSEAKLFVIEFSDLHVSTEDSVNTVCCSADLSAGRGGLHQLLTAFPQRMIPATGS